jgi:ribonuclease BN (tRNA processing enzyme)
VKLFNAKALDNLKEIIVAITHTHSDHIAGLGTFIWYSNFLLNIKPKIISNSKKFEEHTIKLLTLLGVDGKYYEFVSASELIIDGCTLEMLPTTHTDKLDSFGIMFSDNIGKYYYTGDTNNIEFVKKLVYDNSILKIYSECSWESYGAHIDHKELLNLPKEKFVLMHFEDVKLYDYMKSSGFTVANKE